MHNKPAEHHVQRYTITFLDPSALKQNIDTIVAQIFVK